MGLDTNYNETNDLLTRQQKIETGFYSPFFISITLFLKSTDFFFFFFFFFVHYPLARPTLARLYRDFDIDVFGLGSSPDEQ